MQSPTFPLKGKTINTPEKLKELVDHLYSLSEDELLDYAQKQCAEWIHPNAATWVLSLDDERSYDLFWRLHRPENKYTGVILSDGIDGKSIKYNLTQAALKKALIRPESHEEFNQNYQKIEEFLLECAKRQLLTLADIDSLSEENTTLHQHEALHTSLMLGASGAIINIKPVSFIAQKPQITPYKAERQKFVFVDLSGFVRQFFEQLPAKIEKAQLEGVIEAQKPQLSRIVHKI